MLNKNNKFFTSMFEHLIFRSNASIRDHVVRYARIVQYIIFSHIADLFSLPAMTTIVYKECTTLESNSMLMY